MFLLLILMTYSENLLAQASLEGIVAEIPAINTSPLIFLTKGGFLELLQLVSREIIVPVAVATSENHPVQQTLFSNNYERLSNPALTTDQFAQYLQKLEA